LKDRCVLVQTTPLLPAGHFLGREVRAWRIGALTLSESEYEPDTRLAAHAHQRAYLSLVVKGGYRETYGARERHCLSSTVVVHPSGERHENRFLSPGGHLFRVELDEAWLTKLRECGAGFDAPAEAHGGPLSFIAGRMFRELRTHDSVSPLMIEALTLEFAARLSRAQDDTSRGRGPEWMPRVEEYLRAHFADAIRLDDVAAAAGVHASHLNRTFRAHRGCSIGEQVRRLRVETASRMLIESKLPIAQIAVAAGFADQSHFSRVFARITGISPARYRRVHGMSSRRFPPPE
jgi:AraC family transcriptional regulator